MVSDTQDRLAIEAVLSGRSQAYEEIVQRYKKPLFNLALRMSGDMDEADEITQSVFVKAYENLASFDLRKKFFSWLYRIAINEALNVRQSVLKKEQLTEGHASTQKGPDDLAHESQRQEGIQAALGRLTEEYRTVIVLRHFQELSYAEMAEVLQVHEKTVKSRLFTARQQLRDILIKSELA